MEIAIGLFVVLIIFGVIGIIFLATSCVACCCSELGLAPVPAPVFRRDIDPLSAFVYNTQRPVEQPEKHTVNVYIGTIATVEGQTRDVNMRAEGAPDNVV